MKKRNPQDATLRNIRAIKKRLRRVEYDIRMLKRLFRRAGELGQW
jgi:hypothetical protein